MKIEKYLRFLNGKFETPKPKFNGLKRSIKYILDKSLTYKSDRNG